MRCADNGYILLSFPFKKVMRLRHLKVLYDYLQNIFVTLSTNALIFFINADFRKTSRASKLL